jgi:aminopeptidase-like protein
MIGRPDPVLKNAPLWVSGWERSDLGPALVQHGAHLAADPHPEEGFFTRSDNYVLAKRGVVAHTISSFGLHNDYHQPTDDLAHVNFDHLDKAISSLLGPIEWLVNSDFKPEWKQGGRP